MEAQAQWILALERVICHVRTLEICRMTTRVQTCLAPVVAPRGVVPNAGPLRREARLAVWLGRASVVGLERARQRGGGLVGERQERVAEMREARKLPALQICESRPVRIPAI